MHSLSIESKLDAAAEATRFLHRSKLINNRSWASYATSNLDETGTSWTLLSCRGLEFDYEFGWYPAAVFDVDALGLGPLADFGGIQSVRLRFASDAGWPPSAGADSAACGHIACQGVSEFLGVLAVQVDLVVGAVEAEADGTVGLAAIEVVDEEGLDLLGPGLLT